MLNNLCVWICILCAATLVGCASGSVGPRVGMDIPVSGIGAEGDVTSTSSKVGFVGGVSFTGMFNRTWGLRADPQIRSIGGEIGYAGSTTAGDGVVSATGVMNANATFVEVPLMAMFSPTDSGATVHPFICIGVTLSASTATNVSASGTQTYTEAGQSVSAPFSSQSTSSGIGGPYASLLFSGGIRIPISQSWEFLGEARLQQMFTDADVAYYSLYTSSYRKIADVTMSAPTTSLNIMVGLLLRL